MDLLQRVALRRIRSAERFAAFVLFVSAVVPLSTAAEVPVSFVNDVMPVMTKSGCNVGVCHAKAGGGQNGFQLSLLGFEPADDFEHIVKEGRGRRLQLVAPEQSLLLLKGTGTIPHGSGARLGAGAENYALLRNGIRPTPIVDRGKPIPELIG